MPSRTVQLSEEAYTVLCGLVQPSSDVHHVGIFSEAFAELTATFPLADFHAGVKAGLVEYDEEAGY